MTVPLDVVIASYREHAADNPEALISFDGLVAEIRALPEGKGRSLAEQCIRRIVADALAAAGMREATAWAICTARSRL